MKYALMLACAAVSGCTLIDQRTFATSPEAEPVAAAPGKSVQADGRTPLVVINYAVPAPNYRDLLRAAVRAAEARAGNVQYDVIAATPEVRDSSPPQALEVMRGIIAEGVPAVRVHLGSRAEAALPAMQVRVYVR